MKSLKNNNKKKAYLKKTSRIAIEGTLKINKGTPNISKQLYEVSSQTC